MRQSDRAHRGQDLLSGMTGRAVDVVKAVWSVLALVAIPVFVWLGFVEWIEAVKLALSLL